MTEIIRAIIARTGEEILCTDAAAQAIHLEANPIMTASIVINRPQDSTPEYTIAFANMDDLPEAFATVLDHIDSLDEANGLIGYDPAADAIRSALISIVWSVRVELKPEDAEYPGERRDVE